MQLYWCSEPNYQATGRGFCRKTHFTDKSAWDVNNFMRLAQKFAFQCSVLPKTLSMQTGTQKLPGVSVKVTPQDCKTAHVDLEVLSLPMDRRWQQLPLGEKRYSCEDEHCAQAALCAGKMPSAGAEECVGGHCCSTYPSGSCC